MFEQVDGANGDEPVSPVAIARSAAAHPRRSPPTFDLTVRTILHQVVLQQITAPQPKLVIVLFCLFVAGWLPTLFAHALMSWPLFSAFTAEHNSAYRIIFFIVQLSLICGAIAFLSRRHASAVWTPQPLWPRRAVVSLLILLPLLLFHLPDSLSGIQGAIALSGFGVEAKVRLASIHDEAWEGLAYGSSLTGVVCSSILSFAAPALEELVFSGFLINAIAKPYGIAAAVVGAPACFAVVHIFQFGVGAHVIPLFFAGITYASLRVCSGSLLLAVLGHWTINAVIFLPKWVVAVLHFAQT